MILLRALLRVKETCPESPSPFLKRVCIHANLSDNAGGGVEADAVSFPYPGYGRQPYLG